MEVKGVGWDTSISLIKITFQFLATSGLFLTRTNFRIFSMHLMASWI